MYRPQIASADRLETFTLNGYTAVLLGNVKSNSPIRYLFIVEVTRNGEQSPCFYVSSEENAMAKVFGSGSHFLCSFDEQGHNNYGNSNAYADRASFTKEALRLIREKFGAEPSSNPEAPPKK